MLASAAMGLLHAISVLVLLLGMPRIVHAEDRKITQGDVPKPVIERVKQKYPGAAFVAFEIESEEGKSSYEVTVKEGPRQVEVSCSPAGHILAEEEQIALADIPAKVRHALSANEKYASWMLHKAERIILEEKSESPRFELQLSHGTARAELVFTQEGTLAKTEESHSQNKD
jgi:hypothetical protein